MRRLSVLHVREIRDPRQAEDVDDCRLELGRYEAEVQHLRQRPHGAVDNVGRDVFVLDLLLGIAQLVS